MDGYNAEWSQFTVQNQVISFNHRQLRHVKVTEPPLAYPVGSESENSLSTSPSPSSQFLPPQPHTGVVVQKKQGHRVKRMSSLLDSSLSVSGAPPPAPPPLRRIHPAIQSAIQTYQKGSLQHVEPIVKATLPTSEGKSCEQCYSGFSNLCNSRVKSLKP